ncbi:MAG: NAD(P)H-hydrate dehydratase [Desulfobulbaceae bacterium]|nr:NAD(P)H-hydrate dehydratase [Desulfobulbaceae bacterium]
MKLPSSQEMLNLDRSAIEEYKIPGIVLMENAGLGTVLMAEKELGSCENSFAPIFVGPGNNGGDGLVIGRHLHQRGCQPIFFILINPDKLKGDAAVNLDIVKKLRLPYHIVDDVNRAGTIPILLKQFESRGLPCFAIFDAIFGIGLCREVTDHFADTINYINSPALKGKSPVISVDTPSGMDADTGEILGACVRADYTATYCCAKPGHYIHGSASWTGKLDVVDIGIPPEAIHNASISTELSTSKNVKNLSLLLRRKKASHKGSHGHLLLLGGTTGKTGAAILAARGALRSGAGLVTLATPMTLNPVFETTLPEVMTLPLQASTGGNLSEKDWPAIEDILPNINGIVVGPGLGQDPSTAKIVLKIFHEIACPVVFDADALNILACHRDQLQEPGGVRIYTPHPGELSRLLDLTTEQIEHDRLEAANLGIELFTNKRHESILILKGVGTITTNGRQKRFINTTGNPGMAAGGMGDVLSGVIGALICQGLKPMNAAVVGVYLHGAAADILYKQSGPGFYATDVADMIPVARQNLLFPKLITRQ